MKETCNDFFYFLYNIESKSFEIVKINYSELNKDFYFNNSFFGCAYQVEGETKILNSPQLDTALFYKDRQYLKRFIKADFDKLYQHVNCFDWIQENKNIVRRHLK